MSSAKEQKGKEGRVLQEPSRHLKISPSAVFMELALQGLLRGGNKAPGPGVWEFGTQAWAENMDKLNKA